MANVMSAIGGGVRSPRSSDLGFGPLTGRSRAGCILDDPASGSATVVLHAGDGAGVSDTQKRRKRHV